MHAQSRPGARIDPYERLARLWAGGSLVLIGLSRRSLTGTLVASAGAIIAYRGLTGRRRVGRRVGIPRALDVSGTTQLASSPEVVYGYLRDLTHLPRFMDDVRSIEASGEHSYRAGVNLGPLRYDHEVEITREIPGHRFEWRSRPDADLFHRGEVEVAARADGGTDLRLRVAVLPPGGAAMLPFHAALGRRAEKHLSVALDQLVGILDSGY